MSVTAGTRQRRVLLALDHRRNRELLEDWVRGEEALEVADGTAEFDVVVFDGPAFVRERAWLRQTREQLGPVHLPCLLVTPHRDISLLTAELWRDVDDLIATPIRGGELRVRLERQLLLREQSLRTARSNTDLQQFAFVAAHELTTPLTVVIGVLETVLARYSDGLAPEVANLLGAARSSSHRLQHLIDDLLAYSRAGRGPAIAPTDLNAVVREALAQLEAQIELSGSDVVVEELPVVLGDAHQLQLVVGNLVANAIKYRQAGQTPLVHVSAARRDALWCISVTDNGIGIAPDRAEAVFAMFERNHGVSDDRPGSGIGLALCKRIVERHGGEIWIEPAAERGTVVTFSLHPAE